MWALFTKALTRGNSTTQVSIINTSSNFVITAILGFAIFSEALPPLWWLGAAMLVAGNVIIGRKDEGSKHGGDAANSDAATVNSREAISYQPLSQDDGDATKDVDEDVADIGAQDT
jgi:drug/metabolite transporter (DMT)-like permease